MRRGILLILAFLLLMPTAVLGAADVDPALTGPPTASDRLPVIVRLRAQLDRAELAALQPDRRSYRATLLRRLRLVAAESQAPLRALLAARGVEQVHSLLLINALAFEATPAQIAELTARPEVASITLDGSVPPPVLPLAQVVPAQQWDNLTAVQAPTLWGQGFRGEGTVVATLDTGVNAGHQELAANYRGGGNSWFDPYAGTTVPYDVTTEGVYHGTAVMAVLAGATTGVAPEAKWIAAKIFPDSGPASYSAIHRAFAWILDPDGNPETDDAPDVVNNSWSLDTSTINQCITEFAGDAAMLRAAGIAVVFAGGNAGSADVPATSLSPGNNAGNLAVGMVDSTLTISPESSQGPSPCDPAGTVYPDLVAPGVHILTADGATTNGYALATGTSFAAPHVAGIIALLKQAVPLAVGDGLQRAVIESARLRDLGAPGPDNIYGNGMLGGLNAYQNLTLVNRPPSAPVPLVPEDGATGLSPAGLTLSWTMGSDPDGETLRTRLTWGTDPTLNGSTPVWVATLGTAGRVRLATTGLLGLALALVGLRQRGRLLLAAGLLALAAGVLLSCGGGGGGAAVPPATASYTLSGLNAGTTYYWRVEQIDERGAVGQGPVRSFTTAP